MSGSCVVLFDYNAWVARFPEMASITPAVAQMYFAEACQYVQNDACSPVTDLGFRAVLLNYVTAHIANLYDASQQGTGAGPSGGGGMVGRVNNASEGSVSVGTEYPMPATADAAWFSQTPYGAAYWALTARWRRMRYYLGPQPFRQPMYPYHPLIAGWNPNS